ncbi:MAG: asparagine synthase (glutamine-hydrolyzing) [Flavobacterium sp.]|nr:asparagine synthase (glutamine-hydrolyzing) [Flavobacterium sp.]
MCGIFGIITNHDSEVIDKQKVKQSSILMNHRGPDAYEQWGIEGKIELAHLRLSIIDLSTESNQPFFSDCNNYVIVFNGEIYNYLEIKQELLLLGYTFRTTGDTEVLLNAYIQWDNHCVNKFNGDWAFSIYNIKENSLFCSRDRFGVKPFNYSLINNSFIFSSEIKSIINYFPELRAPNYNVIANFCRNSLGAQIKETWFEGVNRLMPAHNLTWKNGEIKIERYWDYPKHTNSDLNFEVSTEKYKELFLDAVKLRMRSDVPVGTTLSSGVDSGSIVSVLRKFYNEDHNTFTAVFNSKDYTQLEKSSYSTDIIIDEGIIVKKLASDLNLNSHLIDIPKSDFCKDLSDVIYHLESGHGSPATIPLSKIMLSAKDHVTVVMEGQGADELLSGYVGNTFPFLIWELFKRFKLSQIRKEFLAFRNTYSLGYSLKLFVRLLNNDKIERLYQRKNGIDKLFGPKLKKYIRIKDYPFEAIGFNERFSKELFKSHTGVLVNLLHYGDAISLSKSIESRLPFMDHRLVEFSFTLPYNFKYKDGLGKYIHRTAMKNIVPDYILENPIKFGFNTPLSQNFESFDSEAIKILLSERCLVRDIFDSLEIKALIGEHVNKNGNNSTIMLRLLSVELWFRHFIDVEV